MYHGYLVLKEILRKVTYNKVQMCRINLRHKVNGEEYERGRENCRDRILSEPLVKIRCH